MMKNAAVKGAPPNESDNSPGDRQTLWASVTFGAALIVSIITWRCLFADGSYYFLRVLQAGTFTEMLVPRSYAAYLFQLPVVIAMKLGVVQLHWLAVAFGIGCLSSWPVALWLCHQMAPRRFWLVMLACAAGYLNAAFMAVGEHIVAHAFFWPALFAILFVRPLTPRAALYLLASALILTHSYESLLFLGPPLVILIVWRLGTSGEKFWQRLVLAIAASLFVAATWIALEAVRHPTNAATLGGFKRGIFTVLMTPAWTLQMSYFIGILFLLLKYPKVEALLMRSAGLVILVPAVLLWGLWPVLAPGNLEPASQYDSRFLDLLVPLLLMPLAWVFSVKPDFLADKQRAMVRLSAAMLVAQSVWHISAAYEWNGYIHLWQHLFATEKGPVLLSKFYGGVSEEHGQAMSLDWHWANPTLSIMVGPNKVQALILPGMRTAWEPFDPMKPESFPHLERYGIDYTAYVNSLPSKNSVKPDSGPMRGQTERQN
jgi:hypothetical protein